MLANMSLACRYSVFIPKKVVLSDIFDYNKRKNMYAALDVTVIQKFSKVIKLA